MAPWVHAGQRGFYRPRRFRCQPEVPVTTGCAGNLPAGRPARTHGAGPGVSPRAVGNPRAGRRHAREDGAGSRPRSRRRCAPCGPCGIGDRGSGIRCRYVPVPHPKPVTTSPRYPQVHHSLLTTGPQSCSVWPENPVRKGNPTMKKFAIGGTAVLATAEIGLDLMRLANADSNSPKPCRGLQRLRGHGAGGEPSGRPHGWAGRRRDGAAGHRRRGAGGGPR